jgi:hypothetical protein
MKAFSRLPDGTIHKIYDQIGDWQVFTIKPDGSVSERWFSIWPKDVNASLVRAMKETAPIETWTIL